MYLSTVTTVRTFSPSLSNMSPSTFSVSYMF
nr:MAG TPA: hypothetical protein [Caudoviricetes sp.]